VIDSDSETDPAVATVQAELKPCRASARQENDWVTLEEVATEAAVRYLESKEAESDIAEALKNDGDRCPEIAISHAKYSMRYSRDYFAEERNLNFQFNINQ
jgi:hypothetical protein